MKDGRNYTVRQDRRRTFYPDEWKKFYDSLKPKNQGLFDFMFNTGSRITEALHTRPCDFDFERNNVRLWKTKTKAKKGETHGKPRTISISSEFAKRMKKLCSSKKPEEYLWKVNYQNVNQLMKRHSNNGIKSDGSS